MEYWVDKESKITSNPLTHISSVTISQKKDFVELQLMERMEEGSPWLNRVQAT